MIFLCTGTQLPFNRLVSAVDGWVGSDKRTRVVGQLSKIGPDDYHPKNIESYQMLPKKTFDKFVSEADLIVGHAGMGAIITALLNRKPIIIMPRRAEFEEHRNDHQIATARNLSRIRGVHVAWSEDEMASLLDKKIDSKEPIGPIDQFADARLISSLRSVIHRT